MFFEINKEIIYSVSRNKYIFQINLFAEIFFKTNVEFYHKKIKRLKNSLSIRNSLILSLISFLAHSLTHSFTHTLTI